jgi:WD40 repeat protein
MSITLTASRPGPISPKAKQQPTAKTSRHSYAVAERLIVPVAAVDRPDSTAPLSNGAPVAVARNNSKNSLKQSLRSLPARPALVSGGNAMRLIVALVMIASGVAGFWGWETFAAPSREEPEISVQLGHTVWVTSVAFSPDGKFALSGSGDKTAKLWELATGRELRTFAHADEVNSVAFSPDGKFALSGSSDKTVKLWELATGRELRSFVGHTDRVTAVAFSPDGRFALSGSSDNTLKLWELGSGRELRSLFAGHEGGVRSVAVSADGKFALSGGGDYGSRKNTLKLWELATGRELRSFAGHTNLVTSVAFSPDGKFALSGSYDTTLKLWELATGRNLRTFTGHTDMIEAVAISPDGKFALSGSSDKTMRLWELATGRELRSFTGHASAVDSVAFSADGKFALSGGLDRTLKLWELATGRRLRSFASHTSFVDSVAFSRDGKFALSGGLDRTLKLWELATGRELRSFVGHTDWISSVAFSPDGKSALSGSHDKTVKLWELATGRELRSFVGHTERVFSVAFSPDGKFALSGSVDNTLKLWELATGRELRSFTGHTDAVNSVAFSPDGKFALSASSDGTLKLWDLATGRELRSIATHMQGVQSVALSADGKLALCGGGVFGSGDNTLKLFELDTGRELRTFAGHTNLVYSVAFSPDGKFGLSGSFDRTVKLWELSSGRELRSLTGHKNFVNSVAFSPDGRLALSGSDDGTTRIWNLQSGEELAAMLASKTGEQLTITPKGFFTASQRDTDMVAIVRGLEATAISQVYQSLYNPDLVREALAGDPDGEVKQAAEVINLGRILDSGPAPEADISQPLDSKSNVDLVTVVTRVKDRGTGIGRIEFRVNDITAAVRSAPAGPGPLHELKQDLALDPGENAIEVVAYNRGNLLASLPAKATIAYAGPAGSVKPKLYVLAIGINTYNDHGWTPPGTSRTEYFPPLGLAVGDATSFAQEMQRAASGLYSDVRIRTALNAEARSQNLDRIFQDLAAEISPRDTFVLFAAAHGYSYNGRFYLIPQDYQGGPNPEALAGGAIGQDKLQDWIANRIKAKKALILLDTCESGALTNGYAHSRIDAPASETAVGRLHEATGRPVLTAAAAGKPAFEGYRGHGVFTWAVIDALYHGDSNGDGLIELSELVDYVQSAVPKISAELNGKGRTAIAVRGFGDDRQTAHFGATGGDFALVRRLQ